MTTKSNNNDVTKSGPEQTNMTEEMSMLTIDLIANISNMAIDTLDIPALVFCIHMKPVTQ